MSRQTTKGVPPWRAIRSQAVFNSGGFENGQAIERVEFVVNASNCQNKASSASPANSNVKQVQLPKGTWGKVCSEFISEKEGGEALYNHWLAPLSVVEKDDIIELSTTSDMIRDRIEQTYLSFLSKIAAKFGINVIELK